MNLLGKIKLHSSKEIEKSSVSIGFECIDRELINPDKCYDLLGKSGVKHARCQTGWARCEKKKGIYDFGWLDDIVDNLLSRGVLPWFNVGYGNPIYMPDPPNTTCVGCVPLLYGKEVMRRWEDYTQRLAEHYADRIEYFEIWNEPNISHFWFPGEPDAAQYAQFIKETGKVIRQTIPGAKIGGCISSFDFSYIEKLAQNITPYEMDFFSYHAYARVPEKHYFEKVSHIKRIFTKYGLGNVSLWQGESGYPSWFPENHWLHPKGQSNEHQQAVWQLRRFFLDKAAGASLTSFFQIADMMERPYEKAVEVVNMPARHGILNGVTYTPKKSYETISRLATVFSGDVVPTDCYFTGEMDGSPIESLSIKCFTFEKDGDPLYAYYLPTDIEAEVPVRGGFRAEISSINTNKPISHPVLIDMLNGNVYEIKSITVNNNTMIMENLPIAEYPMVLCDRSVFETE